MEVPGRTEFDVEENAENIDFRCEPCQSNSTTTPANGFCKDCEEFMCNTCFRQHLNLKLCKHHVLVNSELSSLQFQRSDERKIYCKQHNGETVKFYCRDHDVVGCGDCIILQHKTCQSEYIQDLSDNFQENKEYKSLKENIEKVISNRIVLEKEIQYNKKDNKLMLEKALGDIRQFRLDINEYLDKVESDVIAKVETIMRENETLLTKLENDCQTLSTKLEKITALLNSENFKDNALFIHTVECKPMVSESEVAISVWKSNGMKKYEFVPDQQLHSLSTTAKNLGTLEISTVNVCHQTTKRTSDEGQLPTSLSTDNMCRSKSSNTYEMTSETDTNDYEEKTCVICMDTIIDPKTLKCGHRFCRECIEQQFKFKQQCPICFTVCGEITGDQPGGRMTLKKGHGYLEGYGFGRIDITYNFAHGVQATSETDTNDYEEKTCVICMDTIIDPKTLKCGHRFCRECIEQQFKFKQQCPICFTVCGEITGDQPGGRMTLKKGHGYLEGYGFGRIDITYNFAHGVQAENHPNPGRPYRAIYRTAYLPDNEEGRKIAAMLKVAFERKLVFTTLELLARKVL